MARQAKHTTTLSAVRKVMRKSRRKSSRRIQRFQPLAAELAVPDCARICARVIVATQEPRVMGGGTQVGFNLSTATTQSSDAIIEYNIYPAGGGQ